MRSVLATLFDVAAILSLLPALILFFEAALAATRRRRLSVFEGERPPIAILVPAHNEASIIASTLRTILPQLGKSDRLIVVADNCSDDTHAVATLEGAEVVSRIDTSLRGKGYALDFGVRHLQTDPRDIVIIIDADCQVGPGAIARLTMQCARTSKPVQALYLMRAPRDAGPKIRIAEFAYVVKNWVRPLGLRQLGLPCQLMGTGMAFPLQCITSSKLATGHIVEDLKLGIDLARAGSPTSFCPEALITSEFPSAASGLNVQRARWEHGHLGTILSEAPGLFLHAIIKRDLACLALALDLIVPPLALLALQIAALWLASAAWYSVSSFGLPLMICSMAAVLFATAVLLSWSGYARDILSLKNLAHALAYAVWKIPLYGKFLFARQVSWVRSKRVGEEDD